MTGPVSRKQQCLLCRTTLIVASCVVICTVLINAPVIRETGSIHFESEFVGWPFVYAEGIIVANSSLVGPLYNSKYSWTLQPFFRVVDANALVANVALTIAIMLGTVLVVESSLRRLRAAKQFSLAAILFLVTATAIFTAICSGGPKQYVFPANTMLPLTSIERSASALESLQWWQLAAFLVVSFGITCALLAAMRLAIRLCHRIASSPTVS